jgi:hypothetical protein
MWSAKAWQEWDQWQGEWWKQGEWGQQDDGAKAQDEELDLPKLAREELLQCFVKVAEKLPDGGTDPALQKLAEVVASNWRDEVLPSMLTGWHLLQKSMLSPAERSTVIASASMQQPADVSTSSLDKETARLKSLELDRIETALRTQWQDEELLARDDRASAKEKKHGRFRKIEAGYEAEEGFDSSSNSEAEANVAQTNEPGNTGSSDDIEEGEALLAEVSGESDQENLQLALRAMWESKDKKKVARRTFVQARAVMKDIKRRRAFFRPRREQANVFIPNRPKTPQPKTAQKNPKRSSSAGLSHQNSGRSIAAAADDESLCYRCGKKGHIARKCTAPRPLSANLAEETAAMAESDSESTEMRKEREKLERRLAELNRKQALKKKLQSLAAEEDRVRKELKELGKHSQSSRKAKEERKSKRSRSRHRRRRHSPEQHSKSHRKPSP